MEPNGPDARLNNMSTESSSGFRADPAAVSELGRAYRHSGDALSAQVTHLAATSAMLHDGVFGPVGAALTAALSDAAARQAARARDLATLLTDAHHTAVRGAAAFVDADARVGNALGGLR